MLTLGTVILLSLGYNVQAVEAPGGVDVVQAVTGKASVKQEENKKNLENERNLNMDFSNPDTVVFSDDVVKDDTTYYQGIKTESLDNIVRLPTEFTIILQPRYDKNAAVEYALRNVNTVVDDGFYFIGENKLINLGSGSNIPSVEEFPDAVDCAHYASYVLKSGGLEVPCNYRPVDCKIYGEVSAHRLYSWILKNNIGEIVWTGTREDYKNDQASIDSLISESLVPGDLIFFNWESDNFVDHASIYVDSGLIASHTPTGIFNWYATEDTTEPLNEYRFPDLTYFLVHIEDSLQ